MGANAWKYNNMARNVEFPWQQQQQQNFTRYKKKAKLPEQDCGF
jgi:hypothetical protein